MSTASRVDSQETRYPFLKNGGTAAEAICIQTRYNCSVISLSDVRAAADRIRPHVCRTPFVPSAWLSQAAGADVWLKLEFVQPTGSFKLRGAVNAVAQLRE